MHFGKDRRVRKRAEYRAIQKEGRRVSTPHFVLVIARANQDSPSRLGITASRRVGNSVRRSRLKRLVREAFRAHPEVVPAGYDLVVICKKDDSALGLAQVVSEWRAASGRISRATKARGHPMRTSAGNRKVHR